MEFDELFCLMSVATCLVMSIAMLWLVIPPTMGDDVKRPELLIRLGVGIVIGALLTLAYDHYPAIRHLTCWKM
jgi:hypothetical protein